ncbi:MAG: hypothetical protein ABIL68_05245 [bacterium]
MPWGRVNCLFAAIVSGYLNDDPKGVGLIPQRGIARDGLLSLNRTTTNEQYGFIGLQKGDFFWYFSF